MITFTPDDDPIVEANDCHNPPGSPDGGQFCAKGGLRPISDSLRGRLAKGAQAYERQQAQRRARKQAAIIAKANKNPGDFIGLAYLQRRLTALGEAEEFPEGFTPLVEHGDPSRPDYPHEGGKRTIRAGRKKPEAMPIVDDFLQYVDRWKKPDNTYLMQRRNQMLATKTWDVMTAKAKRAALKGLKDRGLVLRFGEEEGLPLEVAKEGR